MLPLVRQRQVMSCFWRLMRSGRLNPTGVAQPDCGVSEQMPGPVGVGEAVGVPVVSLFAPVVPASQWLPHGRRVIQLGDQNAGCRLTRARECPVAGHPCLDGITDAELLAAIARLEEEP